MTTNATAAGPTAITRLHASRPYVVTKGHRARSIVVTFRLRHRARVFFTLVQVAPTCRVITSFSVAGHRGTNRIRIRAGVGRHKLRPGTYRLTARTQRGRSVLYTTLLVRSHRPSRSELASALRSNACAAAGELASARLVGRALGAIFGSDVGIGRGALASATNPKGAESGTLGVAAHMQPNISTFSPANLSKNARDPLALATLGAAILLLGVAALPRTAIPDPRLTELVVRYRAEVVLAGAAALAAGVLVLVLG